MFRYAFISRKHKRYGLGNIINSFPRHSNASISGIRDLEQLVLRQTSLPDCYYIGLYLYQTYLYVTSHVVKKYKLVFDPHSIEPETGIGLAYAYAPLMQRALQKMIQIFSSVWNIPLPQSNNETFIKMSLEAIFFRTNLYIISEKVMKDTDLFKGYKDRILEDDDEYQEVIGGTGLAYHQVPLDYVIYQEELEQVWGLSPQKIDILVQRGYLRVFLRERYALKGDPERSKTPNIKGYEVMYYTFDSFLLNNNDLPLELNLSKKEGKDLKDKLIHSCYDKGTGGHRVSFLHVWDGYLYEYLNVGDDPSLDLSVHLFVKKEFQCLVESKQANRYILQEVYKFA